MAVSGLTLAVLLFLLLVYLPGNLALLTAGRKQQDRAAPASIFYGAFILATTLGLFWVFALTGRSSILQRFTATLTAITEGSSANGSMDLLAVAAVFAMCYALSCVAGFLELFLITGFYTPPGWARNLFRRGFFGRVVRFAGHLFVVIRGILAGCSSGVRVKPANTILDVFVRFRKAGKRPHLEIALKNGTSIKGECLRFSWNGKESVLSADMDNPCQLEWVALDEAVSIKFLNLALMDAEGKSAEQAERCLEDIRKSRQILNGLAPGYGDEVYGKCGDNALAVRWEKAPEQAQNQGGQAGQGQNG
ncbi:hypothetical protein GFC01_10825 [Desulfofundulus thermobenzoicus]|uniref:Uncharacterized protein n=1 Tax=Desulfofundulus thermobenzoicus TaxID=29376 RepID=A0A6N7ITF6_9FIRM|nr:hypothetical protein [Desulfofundulus thermobenzoicus]MQL52747.1 hypothetical protein [Desulfofundulus thermobenzoicus]HHW44116.1 hypothetical protein [Desulfotomaculum sp.]